MRNALFIMHLIAALALLINVSSPARALTIDEDDSKATILAYHRIDEPAYADTNLSSEQFQQHLQILQTEDYNILPLPKIIEAWNNKDPLPQNTVAITFEGAYRSSYQGAMQALINAKLPFTILYAADKTPTESTQSEHLDWKTLKKLSRNKLVTIGILPASYSRHAHKADIEISKQINKAISRHIEAFGKPPTIFSYPFGEYTPRYRALIEDNETLTTALGLHSAIAYAGSDHFTLPRFSMTEQYASTERFTMITEALPLPTDNITITENTITFTTTQQLAPKLDTIACFISGQDKPDITIENNKVTITAAAPLAETRTRINCTIQSIENRQDKWRWFGLLIPQGN